MGSTGSLKNISHVRVPHQPAISRCFFLFFFNFRRLGKYSRKEIAPIICLPNTKHGAAKSIMKIRFDLVLTDKVYNSNVCIPGINIMRETAEPDRRWKQVVSLGRSLKGICHIPINPWTATCSGSPSSTETMFIAIFIYRKKIQIQKCRLCSQCHI